MNVNANRVVKLNKVLIIFLILQVHMFSFRFIPSFYLKLLSLVITCLLLPIAIRTTKIKFNFSGYVIGVFVMLLLNMLVCNIYSGQSFALYISGTEFINIVGLLTYFVVPFFTININSIEKSLMFVAKIFCIIYIVQYYLVPYGIKLFIKEDYEVLHASLARFRLAGQGFASLLIFYSLNKFQLDKNKMRLVHLFLGLLVLILLNFRTQILLTIMIIFWMLYSFKPSFGKYIRMTFGLVIIAVFLLKIPLIQTKIDQMLERQETGQTLDNDDYVRNRAFFYYTFVLPTSTTESVFGLGLPNERGKYGQKIRNIKLKGLIWADLGLYGFALMAGFPAVVLMLLYSYKAIRSKIPYQYTYIKMWFLFLIVGSLLSREFYREGAFAIQGVVLFLIDIILIREKYENRNINISLRK
ncbi:hypothetical protein [Algibacter pacificus]|uniref:hypothetical protein n=1 Tax=Algibacter pacificus TaxID=2599389 RepID=UPI0011CA982E|nr:hypothetical protein [Algibacter pacificus]